MSGLSIDELLADCELSSPTVVVSDESDSAPPRILAPVAERVRVVEPLPSRPKPNNPPAFKLTIVVPVFNEESTVRQVLDALVAQPIPGEVEIIVVDDGSTDRTKEILQATWHSSHVCVRHEVNRGKGAAVRTGISRASGTHLLVFDADSEYDPADIPNLIAPILSGRAEVVYGVRVRGAGTSFPSIINVFGNRLMTAATNSLYGSAISDLHTCLKLLPLSMLRRMRLEEEGFGLDTEISAELLRRGFRPYEVPVTYVGRSREEGKKIRLSDAFRCVQVLLKVRLRGRTRYGARDKTIAPLVSATMRSEAASVVDL
jgi:glycosyltransferase involved in cell wall biosynthesis